MRSIIEMLFIIVFAFDLDVEEDFEECFDDYFFIE